MFLFLFLLISCWVVAASLMAEKTNVCKGVFIADITSMCGFGSDAECPYSFFRILKIVLPLDTRNNSDCLCV